MTDATAGAPAEGRKTSLLAQDDRTRRRNAAEARLAAELAELTISAISAHLSETGAS